MISYNHTFYKMLKKYILVLPKEKIAETETLLFQRDKLRKELYMIPKIYFLPEDTIKYVAKDVREKYEKDYKKDYEIYSEKISSIKKDIKKISKKVTDEMKPYEYCFEAVHRLWMAQRRYAFEQGNLLQIPATWRDWKLYIGAAGNYLKVQIATSPILWFNRFKYYFQILFKNRLRKKR